MIQNILNSISIWAIPVFLTFVPLYGAFRKIKVYESFVEGAKGGFQIAIRIIPYLVAILVAVGMLRGAGAIDMLAQWTGPALDKVGFPVEILPVAIMRPLSGSGSLGIVTELIQIHGPDSLLGRMAATAYGSTETTFYVLAVYFGSVGIKQARHALVSGLVADVCALIMAVVVCSIAFS
jgi:spore maturation protein B